MWRRFQVAGDITVAQLGYIVMPMYEMRASRLFALEHERPFLAPSGRLSKRMGLIARYGLPSDDDWLKDMEDEDATKTVLSQLDLAPPSRLPVWYDFGDDWRVPVTLEKTLDDAEVSGKRRPCVLAGKGLGIIEDCGGIGGSPMRRILP